MAGSSKPHPDLAFQHLTQLKRATFQLTSEQERTHHAHSIGAVHVNDAGKATRFTVLIVDAERQKAFRQGAGTDIATRRAEAHDQPFDPSAPALTIQGWGAWDIDAMEADPHRQPVFVLAKCDLDRPRRNRPQGRTYARTGLHRPCQTPLCAPTRGTLTPWPAMHATSR